MNGMPNMPQPVQPMPAVQPVQPVTPVQPVPTVQPVQPVPTVQPVEPVPTVQPVEPVQPVPQVQPIQAENTNNNMETQQNLQYIPNVEQSSEQFITNTQTTDYKKSQRSSGNYNVVFVVVLFAIIFASVFILFPYIYKLF